VDLGCGTGIASRQMAARGWCVVGLDPNAEMLRRAVRAGGGVEYLRAVAEVTPLPARCATLATAGNAFHWFDLPRAVAEIDRIAAWGAAFWNSRADSPFNDEYEALLRRFSPEYVELFHSPRGASTTDRLIAAAGDPAPRQAELPYRQLLDRDAFLGRVHSASYVVHGVPDRAGLDAALDDLFGRYAEGGALPVLYRTEVIAWRSRT
jgi:SAM-dependent methyltransferase